MDSFERSESRQEAILQQQYDKFAGRLLAGLIAVLFILLATVR